MGEHPVTDGPPAPTDGGVGGVSSIGICVAGNEPHQPLQSLCENMVGPVVCPVDRFRWQATSRTNIWIHFVHRHVRYIIVILE